ncbi:MAG: biopolymer transporter ExbD [Polyangiaceae bacterium]|nr:biopolymer transporter ExbD [Polyangiaceae bacterium]
MQANGDDEDLIAGINVTPMVDVTLVLLIIFIVTAKIIVQSGLPMDLPKAASGEEVQMIFSVELMADGKTLVDSKPVSGVASVNELARAAKTKHPDLRAVIRAENTVQHGRVIGILDLLKRAGIAKIAFATSKIEEGVPVETSRPK